MPSAKGLRPRAGLSVLAVTASAAAIWLAVLAPAATATGRLAHAPSSRVVPSVKRFNLAGYVIDTSYTLGRNKGNTFQQTYRARTVHGLPIKGPFVGVKFPREDYVAMPIGHHELYVAWLDPKTHALVDVFVMDFRSHVVFDYAPGSAHPESSGTVTIVKRGRHRLP